jgi:hypothetical protein
MAEKHLRSLKKAIEILRNEEREAIERLSKENSADNRALFREIHDTLKTLRSTVREEESKLVRLLKWIGILPG